MSSIFYIDPSLRSWHTIVRIAYDFSSATLSPGPFKGVQVDVYVPLPIPRSDLAKGMSGRHLGQVLASPRHERLGSPIVSLTRLQDSRLVALRPARSFPPKRLLTPRSARRLSATDRGLRPGPPASTRTELSAAGLVQSAGRNTRRAYVNRLAGEGGESEYRANRFQFCPWRGVPRLHASHGDRLHPRSEFATLAGSTLRYENETSFADLLSQPVHGHMITTWLRVAGR